MKTLFLFTVFLHYTGAAPLNTCDSVHIFIARGSIEPYPGRQGALATAICEGISSCGYDDIGYPATFSDYCSSVAVGVSNGTALIESYAAACPEAKLVLTGYSQGAHVIGDILGGAAGSCPLGGSQPASNGLDPTSAPGSSIVAATLFGDVRHTANQPYNVGTGASGNGILPREGEELASLNIWEDTLHSWCLSGDPVCAGGSDPDAHTSYFDLFVSEAASWVKGRL